MKESARRVFVRPPCPSVHGLLLLNPSPTALLEGLLGRDHASEVIKPSSCLEESERVMTRRFSSSNAKRALHSEVHVVLSPLLDI